jgi:small subunit ribosomal protein S5
VSEETNTPQPNPGGSQPGRDGGRDGNRRQRGPRRPRSQSDRPSAPGEDELTEKVIFINRSSKVVKGGRRFSFSAIVVAGDRKGRVGLGMGKGKEVSDAIRKGGEVAKRAMKRVSIRENTIPHEVLSTFGGAEVLLRPASAGTGIKAGRTVRAVLESAGIRDILSKSLGSKNAANVAKATLGALQQLRLREDILGARGIHVRKPSAA